MPLSGTQASTAQEHGLLALIQRSAQIANRSAGFNEALAGVTHEVCAFSGWCASHALVVKPESPGGPRLVTVGNWHVVGATRLESLRRRAALETFARGQDLPGRVWETQAAISVVQPHTKDRRFARMRGLPVGAWFGFPVLSLTGVEGVVEFCSLEEEPMHPAIIEASNVIGALLAAAYMRERLRFFKAAIDNAHDAVAVFRATHDAQHPLSIAYVSPMFERQTGYDASELMERHRDRLFGPGTDTGYVDSLVQRVLQGESIEADLCLYRKNGSSFWAHITMRPIVNARGAIEQVVAVQREITERKRWEQQLELLSTALRQANDAIALYERGGDDRWRISYVNDVFVRTTGFSREDVLGRDSQFMEGAETDRALLRSFRMALMQGELCRGEVAYYKKDGTPFWVDLNARPIIDRDGRTTYSIVLYHDITEARRRSQILSHQASHDELTGLRNRRFFEQALEDALQGSPENDRRHALLFMDLDRFKPINDRHGHPAGDRVLVMLAEQFRNSMREGDVLARVGGDEFAVLLYDCSPDSALRVAKNLLEAVHELRVPWDDEILTVGLSIGVAPCVPGEAPALDVLRCADAACYDAKKLGGDRVEMAQVVA